MKKILFILALVPNLMFAQAIIGTKGTVYTAGVPAHTPTALGSQEAVDTNTNYTYFHDLSSGTWKFMGHRVQFTGTYGQPSYTPDKFLSPIAVNIGDSLYVYQGGWSLVSGGATASGLMWSDTSVLATQYYVNSQGFLTDALQWADTSVLVTLSHLQDTAAAIRGDFPVNTDDQAISISNDTIYLEDGGFVVLPPSTDTSGYNQSLTLSNDTLYLTDGDGTLFSPLSPLLSGYVTGSGTTNELPYWATSSSLGSLSTATYPSLTEISYVKGVTSAIQAQLNAKHGGSLTSGYIPYSSAGGYGLSNTLLYYNQSNGMVGLNTTTPGGSYGTAWTDGFDVVSNETLSGITIRNTLSTGAAFFAQRNNDAQELYFGTYGASATGSWMGETRGGKSFIFTFKSGSGSPPLGILTYGAADMWLGTNNAKRITIKSTGLVGINQASPTAQLDVVGPGSTDASPIGLFANSVGSEILKVNGGNGIAIGGTGAGLYLQSYSASYGGIWSSLVTPSGTNFALLPGSTSTYVNATTTLGFQISGSSKMTATSTGIGIGLTSPSTALDVSGAGTMALFTGTGGTPSRVGINAATGGNAGFDMRIAGTKKWTAAAYLPSGTNYSFTFYNEQTSKAALLINGDTDKASFATDISIGGTTGPSWSSGTGSPEGVVTAPVGSTYSRTDGGTNTSTYRKESGTGNTGWVANEANTDSQTFSGSDDGTNFTLDLSGAATDITISEGQNIGITRSGTQLTVGVDRILDDNVYTPAGTDSSNVSVASILQAQYSRVGSTVTVSGFITITPSAAGNCYYEFNPPIASNFVTPFVGCAGVFNDTDSHFSGGVRATPSTDNIRIQFVAPDGSAHPIAYQYTYRIN